METNLKDNCVYIEVNDIFEDLNEEIKRLKNEFNFANISLNILLKYKTFLKNIFLKYDQNIDSEDKQKLKQLDEELNSVVIRVDEIMKQNDCIKTEEPIIFEIKDNNKETNQKLINGLTDMSTENMQLINEMIVKSEPIFEINCMTTNYSTDVCLISKIIQKSVTQEFPQYSRIRQQS